MNQRTAAAIVASVCLVVSTSAHPSVPDLQVNELATGPYSRMHMLLEKTILAVDVLTVEVRFGHRTQQQFQTIVQRGGATQELMGRVADAAVHADDVFIALEFKRDVSLHRWVQAVRDSLGRAESAQIIDQATLRHVSENLPVWFHAIAERGFRDGDRILYRVHSDSLRTVLVAADGRVLLDQTDSGAAPRLALLGGYFAPGTEFREPLIKSLLGVDPA